MPSVLTVISFVFLYHQPGLNTRVFRHGMLSGRLKKIMIFGMELSINTGRTNPNPLTQPVFQGFPTKSQPFEVPGPGPAVVVDQP